eukprot:TRINITY_DN95892_c0_g1_i1.p1 TRINITY_DN95892_c0_g1~~TRINITY_DN95892_c0_g1_i1.p1  ORF type:complete len:324 (+),score=36.83 TRINITY_DN95892_c0_g1_i1:95-1066(+)
MKTKGLLFGISALLLASTLAFTSCKKKQAFKNEDGQASADNRTVQSENDAAVNDVNTEISNNSLLRGRTSGATSIQRVLGITATGYNVDTTGIHQGTIKINYDGTTINNRSRTGSIRLTIQNYAQGKRWKDAGCVLQVDYLSYKITRASDSKSVQFNGTQLLTNITGDGWWELLVTKTKSSIATSVTGTNLNVLFDDGKTAVYNINRKFTYTYPNNILTCTGEGIGSADGLSSLENYGTTRDGDAFTSQVSTPIVWNFTCGWWAPIQGKAVIKVDSKDFSLDCTFGVDASGNPVSVGANQCPYGWKVEWSYKNKTSKKIFGYS